MDGIRGKIFFDKNINGIMDAGEAYNEVPNVGITGITATLTGAGISLVNLTVNPDGSFSTQNTAGGASFYLKVGSYTLTINNPRTDLQFFTSKTSATASNNTGGVDKWFMDIPQSDINAQNTQAVYNFSITSASGLNMKMVGAGLRTARSWIPVNHNIGGGGGMR
jgi:hypothetical protein